MYIYDAVKHIAWSCLTDREAGEAWQAVHDYHGRVGGEGRGIPKGYAVFTADSWALREYYDGNIADVILRDLFRAHVCQWVGQTRIDVPESDLPEAGIVYTIYDSDPDWVGPIKVHLDWQGCWLVRRQRNSDRYTVVELHRMPDPRPFHRG